MARLLGVLLLLAILCSVILNGCSKNETTISETPTTPVTTSKPTSGPQGELVVGISSLGSDSFRFIAQGPPQWNALTNERLIRFNYDNEKQDYYPLLAEKYEFNSDYSALDIYLKQGIQWHDGWGELTAEDVQYTWDVLHNDPERGSYETWWYGPVDQGGFIESTEVIDKYHFRFNFSTPPYAAWFCDLCYNSMGMQCKKYFETVGYEEAIEKPIGTGPWQLIEHVSGSHFKLKAFDNYWGKKPEFQYLTIRLVPEVETQIQMLKTGQLDLIQLSLDKILEIEAAGLPMKIVADSTPLNVNFGGQLIHSDREYDPTVPWVTHTDEPEDSDWNQRALKVRHAFNLAINKQAILEKILNGAGTLTPIYCWPPSVEGYKPEWTNYPYDPDMARQLLAEAGYSDGFEKPIIMFVDSGASFAGISQKVALAVANDLESIGLDVKRQVVEDTTEQWYLGHKSAWHMNIGTSQINPDPTVWWMWFLSINAPGHEAFMSFEFEKYITEYSQSLPKSKEERLAIAQAGAEWIYRNQMIGAIGTIHKVYTFGPKIKEISRYEAYFANLDYALNFEFIVPEN